MSYAKSCTLDNYLSDEEIREVMVNSGSQVWIERHGQLSQVDNIDPLETRAFIERTLLPLGRRIDIASPIVDARLEDGSRMCAVVPPIAIDGPCLAIRRFGSRSRTLGDFAPAEICEILQQISIDRRNIIVSGAASAGKTTLLNALCQHIDANDRIITIEDIAELQLNHPQVVRLEARPACPDGNLELSTRSLLRTALRLRPDRLIIGEVRGPETIDMLTAMNTGHNGSMSTIHANSSSDAIHRIESLVLQHALNWSREVVIEHLMSSIDVIVHVKRNTDGNRSVDEVLFVDRSGFSQVVANGHIVKSPSR